MIKVYYDIDLNEEYFPPCESGEGICNPEDCAYYDRELCTGDKDD